MTRPSAPFTLLATGAVSVALAAGAVLTAGSAQASVPACSGSLIKTTHSFVQGAMGHSYVTFRFRNISQSTCSLTGYPGLDARGAGGRTLRSAERTQGTTPGVQTVVLDSWQVASAYAQYANFNPSSGGSCRHSAKIAVTPPNTSATKVFDFGVNLCGLQIHPVVPGRTGVEG